MGQFPNWLFQNMYSPGLEPEDTFNTDSMTVQDTPLDAEKILAPFKADDSNFNQIEGDINSFRNKLSGVDENIKNLSQQINYDPLEKAEENYRNLYKWKGASKKRKLGSIGIGILDALTSIDSGRGLKSRQEEKELKRYELLKERTDKQISAERGRESSLNNLFGKMSAEYEKARINKQKNEFILQAKQEANKIQDTKVRNQFIVEASKAASQGLLNQAKIEEIKANLTRPKNMGDFSALAAGGKLPEGSVDIYKDLLKAGGRGNVARNNRYFRGPAEARLSFDDKTGEFNLQRYTPTLVVNPLTNEALPSPFDKAPENSTYLSPMEEKRFEELNRADNLLYGAAVNTISDLKTGRIKDYAGLLNSSVGRYLSNLFRTEAGATIGQSLALQNASFGSLMHVKAVYGGRAPEALIKDLETLVEGKGASPTAMASIFLTQAALTRANLLEMSKHPGLNAVKGDPRFYNYLKGRMAAIVDLSKNGVDLKDIPRLEKIIGDYLTKRDTASPATSKAKEMLRAK